MLMYKIYIHHRTSGQWRNRKHRDFALWWRYKLTRLPFWVLQKPVGRTQHHQAGTNEDEPVWRKESLLPLSTQTAHPTWHSMARPWERKLSTLLRRDRHEWPVWAVIWLRCSCLEDCLSGVTRRAEGMGTSSWCSTLSTLRTGKYLLKHQRDCRAGWHQERNVWCAMNKKQQTLQLQQLRHYASPEYVYCTAGYYIVFSIKSKSVYPGTRGWFLNSQTSAKDHKVYTETEKRSPIKGQNFKTGSNWIENY